MSANNDDTFAKYVLQTGMATDAQIARARERLTESTRTGASTTLPEVMVQEGIITTAQRENVEQKLKASAGIQQLGNYKLIKKLGEGGMGVVYLAEDTVAYRKVALKILAKKYVTNTEFLARFRREAQALGRLNHPNIVAGFSVGEDKGYQFYAMEFCEGDPLDKRLKREKKLAIADAIDITTQVARGLQYAHERNTIHRDIKPGNIFMTTDKTVKILDMGLSKTIGETDNSFNTQAGVTVGTPHYISPEQARGRQDIDGRADIYSLGATFYHFITGQTPFEGPTSAVIMTKHLTDQLPNPCDLRPDCPPGIAHVITKMMAKKPDDRYLNCAELVEDLEQIAAGRPPSSPALDSVQSSIGMRSVRVPTGKFKPVGGEREGAAPSHGSSGAMKSKRATGKRDPVTSPEDRPISKRMPTRGERPIGEREGDEATWMADVPVAPAAPASSERARRASGGRARPELPDQDRQDRREQPEPERARPASAERAAAPVAVAAASVPSGQTPAAKKKNPALMIGAAAGLLVGVAVVVAFSAGGKPPVPPAPQTDTQIASAESTATHTSLNAHPSPPPPPAVSPPPPAPHPIAIVPPSPPTPTPTTVAISHTPSPPAPAPAPAPPKANSSRDLKEMAQQFDAALQARNFAAARELLAALERDVAEYDTYNPEWCGKLDGYAHAVVSREKAVKDDFFKELIGVNDLGPTPAGAIQLFHGGFKDGGTDGKIHWSPRTIKFLTGKMPWVDGTSESQRLGFDAPKDLLNPGPLGHVVIDYNALTDADAVVKFQVGEDRWKEFPVTLTAGRMMKADVQPGPEALKGLIVSKISIEFTAHEYQLAVYRVYLTK